MDKPKPGKVYKPGEIINQIQPIPTDPTVLKLFEQMLEIQKEIVKAMAIPPAYLVKKDN